MTRESTVDHDAAVDAIVAQYDAATAEERAAGRAWYPNAGRIIAGLAEWSGLDPSTMAAVVAALSPRNPWAWNVQDAATFAWAATHRDANGDPLPMPGATTFGANRRRAWAIATGRADWTGTALKVRSFVLNMTGNENAVTVDIWARRVALGDTPRGATLRDVDYVAIAGAYRAAAALIYLRDGEAVSPRDLQAITWVHAEATGYGSKRRGRHGATLKVGTLAIVASLLAAAQAIA